MMQKQFGPADREYCLTADGKLCEPTDKAASTVLVHKDGYCKLELAIKYGLVEAAPAEVAADPESKGESSPAGGKKSLDLRKQGSRASKGARK